MSAAGANVCVPVYCSFKRSLYLSHLHCILWLRLSPLQSHCGYPWFPVYAPDVTQSDYFIQHLMTQCLEHSIPPVSDTTLVSSPREQAMVSLHPTVWIMASQNCGIPEVLRNLWRSSSPVHLGVGQTTLFFYQEWAYQEAPYNSQHTSHEIANRSCYLQGLPGSFQSVPPNRVAPSEAL